MLNVLGRSRQTCDGTTRRELLTIGGAGMLGMSLPKLWAAEKEQVAKQSRAKSVLFVFLYGGPSQLETFDMKPDAPASIRGPFQPIASRTPGLHICEHLPRLAGCSNEYAVVRTVHHPQNDHNGTHIIQTGRPLPPANRGAANVSATDKDWPAFGSVISYLDAHRERRAAQSFPGYVYLPRPLGHFAGYDINGQYSGWLGKAYNPMATRIQKRAADDNPYFRDCTDDELDFRLSGLEAQPGITLNRFDRRQTLLEQLSDSRRSLESHAAVRDYSGIQQQALHLLASPKVAEAFDIRREPARLRDRYGRNLFGQSLLMGRRMIEAGSRFVTVAWDLAVRGDNCGSWDMHACLERVMKNHLLPGLDVGLSALLADMRDRGLLDETLVFVAGEMGRTPNFKNRGQSDGRDHWSYCFPCLFAGAGTRCGTTFGSSDKNAAYPVSHPAYLNDACSGDETLLRDVKTLLAAHRSAGKFLQDVDPVPEQGAESTAQPDSVGSTIGPYTLRKQIGEGGFGIVYSAEQQDPIRRTVALKLIKPGMDTKQVLARFEAERQALAMMDHPNIARLHDAGATAGGRPYFVMEFVDGIPITRYCDENRLTRRQRLELFTTVCRAVQHAHQKGIIHRDIKPGNVLLTRVDDAAVPKVIDFGIAKATMQPLTDQSLHTRFTDMVGTPMYMSPEQAQMGNSDVDTRSDVYSLGALLYELLTGRPPFESEQFKKLGAFEQLRVIRDQEPRKPSARAETGRVEGAVPDELDWIVMKALEKDRNRRYESASALADDVERHLGDEPVVAGPPSRWYRFTKMAKRRKRTLGSIVVVALGLMVAAGMSSWWAVEASNAYASEYAARLEAEQQRGQAVASLKWAEFRAGFPRYNGWRTQITRLVKSNPALVPQYPITLEGLDATRDNQFPTEASSVAFDSAGTKLLIGGTARQAGGIWDEANRRYTQSRQSAAGPVVFSRKGTPLQLTAGRGAAVELWDRNAGKRIQEFRFARPADNKQQLRLAENGLGDALSAISPDGAIVAAAAKIENPDAPQKSRGLIAVWNADGARRHQFSFPATALAISPDGGTLAAGDARGTIQVWSLETGKSIGAFRKDHVPIYCLAFHADVFRAVSTKRAKDATNWLLASGDAGGLIVVWDVEQQAPRSFCRGSNHEVYSVAFNPSGTLLASCGRSFAAIWDAARGSMLLKLHQSQYMTQAAWSPDGKRLAISSMVYNKTDTGVVIWNLDFGRGIQTLRGLADSGAKVAFSPDGRYLAALTHSWQVGIWSLTDRRLLHVLRVAPGSHVDNAALAFSRDGKRFAFAAGMTASLWEVSTGRHVRNWTLPEGLQDRLVFHPTGNRLLSMRCEAFDKRSLFWESDRRVRRVCRLRDLFSNEPTKPIAEIKDFAHHVFYIAAAPDGATFVIDGEIDEKTRLAMAFDGVTATNLWSRRLTGISRTTYQIPISNDRVSLPAANNGATVVTLKSGKTRDLSYLPTTLGRQFFAEIHEDRARLRDAQTSKRIAEFGPHRSPSNYESQFSPDGREFDLESHRETRRHDMNAQTVGEYAVPRLDRLSPGENPDGFEVRLRHLPARCAGAMLTGSALFAQRYSAWLLPIPLWLGLRGWARTATATHWLRLVVVVFLLLCLGGPKFNVGGKGLDIVLVIDRSRSLPKEAPENIKELQQFLDEHRKPGDRIGLISFGREAHIEQLLSEHRYGGSSPQVVSPEGSDLNDAILKALSLTNPDRPARILVLGDGESNGPNPLTAARRAREDGVPIDYRLFERARAGDVAVKSLDVPKDIYPNEPFFFSVSIHSDGEATGKVTLYSEGMVNGKRERRKVAEVTRRFRSGNNRVPLGHVLKNVGSFQYHVEVDVDGDPLPANNIGTGVVRVKGAPRLLLLVRDDNAKTGRLARLLTDKNSGLTVDVRVARNQPLTKDQLDKYRGIILENVPADHLGFLKMSRIAQFVTDRGLGLMLTGGENSFGTGGYFKSPLDRILPVSMEMREDDRKAQVAIAVVLDRSGSMSAMVGGRTKMELANLGTAECVNLLTKNDKIAVISVDTSPHVNQGLTDVTDQRAISSRIHRITVGGGGIFVDVGLEAARIELEKARGVQTRHVILFSDASDTEISRKIRGPDRASRQELFFRQVRALKASGITVSVIGLGERTDVHAALLTRIAEIGGGNVMFASDARDLPRLFAQDTINVARNTFIRKTDEQPEGIPGQRTRGPHLVGRLGNTPFPNVDGYNLSYLRKEAQVAVVSKDKYLAPWSAFWNRGLGRASAITFEVGGEFTGNFARWQSSKGFLLTHARWLLGGDDPRSMYVQLDRDGQDGVVTVELDDPKPGEAAPTPKFLRVIPPGREVGEVRKTEFVWIDRNLLQARFRMDGEGVFYTTIVTGESSSFPGPSIALPYSPEFFPRDGLPTGRETLAEMARLSGGRELTDVVEVLNRDLRPRQPRMVSLLPWLLGGVMILLLAEIAGRRLSLWAYFKNREWKDKAAPAAAGVPEAGWLPKWKLKWSWKRARRKKPTSATVATPPKDDTAPKPAATPSMSGLLEQAKHRAQRRRKE
eukprot:g21415.t1